jgi:hypothetical protein
MYFLLCVLGDFFSFSRSGGEGEAGALKIRNASIRNP